MRSRLVLGVLLLAGCTMPAERLASEAKAITRHRRTIDPPDYALQAALLRARFRRSATRSVAKAPRCLRTTSRTAPARIVIGHFVREMAAPPAAR